jgi:hypothetical protein
MPLLLRLSFFSFTFFLLFQSNFEEFFFQKAIGSCNNNILGKEFLFLTPIFAGEEQTIHTTTFFTPSG